MKQTLLFFSVLFFTLNAVSQDFIPLKQPEQFLPNVQAGYQHSGIFDTVKAIILIDNKQLKKLDRIEGYAVREWETWYGGGCDPFFNSGYSSLPDQWFETGDYLYYSKKKITSKIWQTEILVNEFTPKPKLKEVKDIEILPEDTDTTLVHINTTNLSSVFAGTVDTSVMLTTSSTGRVYWLGMEKIDTEKVVIYIDTEDPFNEKIKLKKELGFKITKYNSGEIPVNIKEYFYNTDMLELGGVITYKKFNW